MKIITIFRDELNNILNQYGRNYNKILMYGLTSKSINNDFLNLIDRKNVDISYEYIDVENNNQGTNLINPENIDINLYDFVLLIEPYFPHYARINIITRGWDSKMVYDLFSNLPFRPFVQFESKEICLPKKIYRNIGHRL